MTSYLALALSVLLMVSVLGQDECGGPLSRTPFENIPEALAYFARCTYQTKKLNVECLLSSCPTLNATCPFTSEGSVNETALTSTMSILNECIGQEKLICGINMSHVPQVQTAFTTAQLIPPEVASGTVAKTGTGYVDHLTGAEFTVIGSDNRVITLAIQAPDVVSYGNYSANFSIPAFTQLLPTAIYFPEVKGHFPLNISFTAAIDLSTVTPSVVILEDHSVFKVGFSNFVIGLLGSRGLEQTTVDLLNGALTAAVKTSAFPSVVYNFLSTYAALSLRAAQINCP